MLSLKKKKSLNFEWSDLAENNNIRIGVKYRKKVHCGGPV